MKNLPRERLKYIVYDLIAAALSYTLFYIYRKVYIESIKFGYSIPVHFSHKFVLGIILIPIFWLALYYFTGYYKDIFRKSRLNEIGQTFYTVLVGVLIIFFVAILDDEVKDYQNYYYSFCVLFSLQFFLTYIPRVIHTSWHQHLIKLGKITFSTLIIGGGKQALDIYLEIIEQKESPGTKFIGFIHCNNGNGHQLAKYLPALGTLENMVDVIRKEAIEEVIIAIDPSEHDRINFIVNTLHNENISIKAIPDLNDLLTGRVKLKAIFGTPLITISHDLMTEWEVNLKYFIDIAGSLLALVLSLPLSIALAIAIRASSKGPILYHHERIGRYGKPFKIYKFRSMYIDAEKNGPELSSKNDRRITSIGKFMRKYRMDEIPNFINVLKGEMSIVGPRPERQYFIEQIVKRAPYYLLLHRVKPGITSWGQVKYGYAENVDQMLMRLRFDLLYIENMSLGIDFKIMIYTFITIFKADGM
jgi:exopolysaccharide biosynthesis polyprenyl glycosylphosphotransferase